MFDLFVLIIVVLFLFFASFQSYKIVMKESVICSTINRRSKENNIDVSTYALRRSIHRGGEVCHSRLCLPLAPLPFGLMDAALLSSGPCCCCSCNGLHLYGTL